MVRVDSCQSTYQRRGKEKKEEKGKKQRHGKSTRVFQTLKLGLLQNYRGGDSKKTVKGEGKPRFFGAQRKKNRKGKKENTGKGMFSSRRAMGPSHPKSNCKTVFAGNWKASVREGRGESGIRIRTAGNYGGKDHAEEATKKAEIRAQTKPGIKGTDKGWAKDFREVGKWHTVNRGKGLHGRKKRGVSGEHEALTLGA